MASTSKSVNAGTHNAVGIEFQKHCALYILFSNYNQLKSKKYFICIEHYDDVLFCLQGDANEITHIEGYQVKKSSDKWGLTQAFYEILAKLARTGTALENDQIPKSSSYEHTLQFLTNHAIALLHKQQKPLPAISELVNESNSPVKFNNLPTEIKDVLNQNIELYLDPDKAPLDQVENISLAYIDFPKKTQSQLDQLAGFFRRTVNPTIADPIAAIDTLLKLFRVVETTLNNGNISKLLDVSKRIGCEQINNVIDMISSRQKAYKFWREEGKELSRKLNISITEQMTFEKSIQDSFDFFKDLKQAEHRKILAFTKSNKALFDQSVDEVECVHELHQKFKSENNSPLLDTDLKSAIVAAYIETRETL